MRKPADVSQWAWDEEINPIVFAMRDDTDSVGHQFRCLTEEAKFAIRLQIARSLDAAHAAGKAEQREALHLVFQDFPGPDNKCVFVEAETPRGVSVRAGEWRKRPDGLAELVIPAGLFRFNPT